MKTSNFKMQKRNLTMSETKFRMEIHVPCKETECLLVDQVKIANIKFSDLKKDYRVDLILHKNNKLFLPDLYNSVLREIRADKQRVEELDYVAFCHSDVSFDVDSVVTKLVKLDGKYDIAGFAGAKKLNFLISPIGWWPSSTPHPEERYGRIKQVFNGQLLDSFFNIEHHSNVTDTRVATIDGLCMMLGRNVIKDETNLFEESYKANNFYDLDFCLSNLFANRTIGVIIEHVFHASVGMSILTDGYKKTEQLFKQKWYSKIFSKRQQQIQLSSAQNN